VATATKSKPAEVRAPAPQVGRQAVVPLGSVRPSPDNPRKTFPEESLRDLVASIKADGILDPLLVRPVGLMWNATHQNWDGGGHFEIVDGERRYRAAKLARLVELPVNVRELTDEQADRIRLVSFAQREDLLPSEQAAGYARVAAKGKTAEAIAAEVGKPVGFVRGLLRLAKLPPWALGAVDAGRLPRATAELVARVPGEESRKKAVYCVVTGRSDPRLCDFSDDWEHGILVANSEIILTYNQTRELIRTHFTRELKQAPFSRAALDLVPEAGSCDACPKRAGNDPEAMADGARQDMCLDPDCYRTKVEAYRQQELDKAAKKGIVPVPDEFSWPVYATGKDTPPKGWSRVDQTPTEGELNGDFKGYQGKKLGQLLGKDGPQQYVAFRQDKPVVLVKTAEARKALVAAGVIEKPEPRKKAAEGSTEKPDHPNGKPHAPAKPAEPREWEIDDRANLIAAAKVRDVAEANFDSLDPLASQGGPETDAAYEALRFVGRCLIRDWLEVGDTRLDLLKSYVPDLPDHYSSAQLRAGAGRVYKLIEEASPRRMLGFLLHLTAGVQIAGSATERAELLGHYDVDWAACQAEAREQLVREMNPEAEGGTEPANPPAPPAVIPVGKCRVCGCVEENCQKCVERTGSSCSWTSEKEDLCTACLPLIEADISVLFSGRNALPDQGTITKLNAAFVRTIGHILALDPKAPPKGITPSLAGGLQKKAREWLNGQLIHTKFCPKGKAKGKAGAK
jgi:ParB/RepB/Spo0J family partition protein